MHVACHQRRMPHPPPLGRGSAVVGGKEEEEEVRTEAARARGRWSEAGRRCCGARRAPTALVRYVVLQPVLCGQRRAQAGVLQLGLITAGLKFGSRRRSALEREHRWGKARRRQGEDLPGDVEHRGMDTTWGERREDVVEGQGPHGEAREDEDAVRGGTPTAAADAGGVGGHGEEAGGRIDLEDAAYGEVSVEERRGRGGGRQDVGKEREEGDGRGEVEP